MLIVSVIVHVAAFAAVVVFSALAPALLPSPARHIVWAHEAPRPVRLVDIQLQPRAARTRSDRPSAPAPLTRVTQTSAAAPIVAPASLPTEDPGAAAGAGATDVSAVENGSGSGSFDGLGVNESAPVVVERPTTPVRLHSGIEAPRKIVDVAPAYPVLARTAGIQGIVILEVVIDDRGAVMSSRVLRSVALLDQAALDAVNRWRFEPARLNGEAIPVVMTVTVNFRLDR
jgi:protein TonB